MPVKILKEIAILLVLSRVLPHWFPTTLVNMQAVMLVNMQAAMLVNMQAAMLVNMQADRLVKMLVNMQINI